MSSAVVADDAILKEAASKFISDEKISIKPTSGGVNNVVQVIALMNLIAWIEKRLVCRQK